MPMSALPVVLVPNGTPVTPAQFGAPVTVVSDTAKVVQNGDAVQVRTSGNVDGHNATATVSGGNLFLKFPSTVAMVDNSDALTGVAPTGTYTNTVTFTVVNGAITAITLS